MMRATWNGTVIAERGSTDHLSESESQTTCPWKGQASYCHVEAGGERLDDAAWSHREPKSVAAEIEGRIAFWKGVRVEP